MGRKIESRSFLFEDLKVVDAPFRFSNEVNERYMYNMQHLIYAISDTIFQFLFSGIYADVFDEILFQ